MATNPSHPEIPRPNSLMSPDEIMSAAQAANGDGHRPKPKPARKLPDPAICRAKSAGFGDYADCLVGYPDGFQYALAFGLRYLCRHPERAEIIARTKAA